tara:strand:- start:156 stop:761 length:606 start_codon:yes stop_codon:yes gene_type:complete
MKKFHKLAVFGDSLVKCGNLQKKRRWTELLKKNLKKRNKKFKIRICSFNGITTSDALKIMKYKPKNNVILLFLLGANDSTYYKSLMGKPRVNVKEFQKNYIKLVKKFKKSNNRSYLITGHKFSRKRLEGNMKTHSKSYLKYKSRLRLIANKTKSELIDTYKELDKFSTKSYCLKSPDGLHQNNFGSKKYFELIFNKIERYF